MCVEARCRKMVDLLKQLEEIMKAENARNWLPGIQAARAAGERYLADATDTASFERMLSDYRRMPSSAGGFDDFFVWRESFSERLLANKDLDRIKDELWKIVEEV